MKTPISLTLLALLAAATVPAQAAVTIYQDNFDNGTGSLNGQGPDFVSGDFGTTGATWSSTSAINANGDVNAGGGTTDDGGAYLPFIPTAGSPDDIFTLEAKFTLTTDPGWMSLGFRNNTSNGFNGAPGRANSGGAAWALITRTDQAYWAGPGASGLVTDETDVNVGTAEHTYTIVMDLTAGLDSANVSFSIDGTERATITGADYSSSVVDAGLPSEVTIVPLSKIQISFDGTPQGSYNSLTLTQIPEPQSFALIAGALALVSVMLRRRDLR